MIECPRRGPQLTAILIELSDHVPDGKSINDVFPKTTALVRELDGPQPMTLPNPDDGCACTMHAQNAGGCYTEYVLEYEPACPEHSDHLYDPRSATWISREPLDRATEVTS